MSLHAAGLPPLSGARAQGDAYPKDKLLTAGQLRLAGRPMRCGATPTLISYSFWDYGGATKDRIILNPSKLDPLPVPVQLFVYAHECGHQIYGPKEIGADCYAIKRGRREGWLNRDGLTEICTFFQDHPGDYAHPPGPQRCEIMTQCFDGGGPQRAGG
ncbi:MAG: hypothetical protein VX871_10525 [Pseudomonadota bacterium]|nr:hypothetical protein [Pseudomonadota bacterium]